MQKILVVFLTALLTAVVGALFFVSCASRPTERRSPTVATLPYPADGRPPVVPPTGNKVIVPGDNANSGISGTPSGASSSTGTNGQAVGPTLGGPSGGGN